MRLLAPRTLESCDACSSSSISSTAGGAGARYTLVYGPRTWAALRHEGALGKGSPRQVEGVKDQRVPKMWEGVEDQVGP